MAVYAIYHINFVHSKNLNLPVYDMEPATADSYRLEFEKCLSGSIPVYKTEIDKTHTPIECTIEKKRDFVTLLMLKNEKSHKYLEGKDDKELIYHPGCYIMIDNRPGKALMAIERTNSFESKPDKVRDLLQAAFNNILKDREMQVDIRARLHEGEFWDAIDEQCNELNDRIKRVSFDFPNPDIVKNVDASVAMTQKLAILSAFTAAVNAAKGTLNMEANKDDALRLDRTQEDLAQMVQLCCRNGYSIAVRFQHYGLYRYGHNIKAFGHIDECVINEFISGQTVLGKAVDGEFDMIHWLDNIFKSTELYIDEESSKKTRKTSH